MVKMNHRPPEHTLVEFKASPIHAMGGFARVDLWGGQRVIEYVGPKLSKAEALIEQDRRNAYLFALDDDYDIDGSVAWNLARYLNHSCEPNCVMRMVANQIWLYTQRAVQMGEELTYNYGHSLSDYKNRPCHCGAATCVGYRVAEKHFATIRKRHPF